MNNIFGHQYHKKIDTQLDYESGKRTLKYWGDCNIGNKVHRYVSNKIMDLLTVRFCIEKLDE